MTNVGRLNVLLGMDTAQITSDAGKARAIVRKEARAMGVESKKAGKVLTAEFGKFGTAVQGAPGAIAATTGALAVMGTQGSSSVNAVGGALASLLASGLTPVGIAIAAATAALSLFIGKEESAKKVTDEATKALERQASEFLNVERAARRAQVAAAAGVFGRDRDLFQIEVDRRNAELKKETAERNLAALAAVRQDGGERGRSLREEIRAAEGEMARLANLYELVRRRIDADRPKRRKRSVEEQLRDLGIDPASTRQVEAAAGAQGKAAAAAASEPIDTAEASLLRYMDQLQVLKSGGAVTAEELGLIRALEQTREKIKSATGEEKVQYEERLGNLERQLEILREMERIRTARSVSGSSAPEEPPPEVGTDFGEFSLDDWRARHAQIDDDARRRQAQEHVNRIRTAIERDEALFDSFGRNAASSIESNLLRSVRGGEWDAFFAAFSDNVTDAVLAAVIKATVGKPLENALGQLTGLIGAAAGSVAGTSAGAEAVGSSVPAGFNGAAKTGGVDVHLTVRPPAVIADDVLSKASRAAKAEVIHSATRRPGRRARRASP